MTRRLAQSTAYTVMMKLFTTDTSTAATGKTVALTISKAGGAFGNPAAGASNATEVSSGWYKFALGTGDTDTLGDLVIRGTSATCNDVEQIMQVVSATSGGYTNLDAAVSAVKTKTDFLPSATAGAAGGVFIAGTNAATTVTTSFTTTFTGNLTGSVGSVTGAVGSVTGLTASDVGAIKTKTDFLPSATAGSAGGVFIAGTNAATAVTTSFTTTFTGNLTGNVGGTINGLTATALKDFFDTDSTTTYGSAVSGSVVKEIADNASGGGGGPSAADIADAVWDEDATGHQTQGTFGQAIGDPGADTDTIFALINTNLNATVSSRATQTSVDDLPTNAELATALGTADDAVLTAIGALPTADENADALLDRADAIETGLTPRQAMRLSAAADGGKVSGGATTTNTFRNAVADDTDRIIATVDADGNRTAITYDLA